MNSTSPLTSLTSVPATTLLPLASVDTQTSAPAMATLSFVTVIVLAIPPDPTLPPPPPPPKDAAQSENDEAAQENAAPEPAEEPPQSNGMEVDA